ncbi:uncharacterized protein LOC135216464 [Macrobrachium nipponense]|uniref:uncharacterized protein LOC135216464 n=1 Tax=Macrobrachium nipponense TaxID=159736 RepID=UPI0030C84D9C
MYVQREVFGDEVKALSRELSVGKSSPIYKLDPFLDSEDGLLKVGGRIRRSDIPQSAKHPILLPKRHHVTTLLIRHEHELLAHSGRNHVLSNLRQEYWIINANATVRNVLFHCVTCRKLKEPALSQKMADLPADRLEPSPPFSNVGIDLFGPYYIKEGRKELKRYGVIFTCLVSRSIHIETANTLQSDSFINALRRFVSRRGHPKVIRCDNGTNFHGAERELKAALDEMEEKKIEKYLSHHHIEWKFNPPAASHMGGCWERQIRTVRKVLSALVKEFGERLNDESLRTLLCEVESIVNSRPLTTVSDSVDDLEPLTPNHLLIPKSYVIPPPGLFQKDDVYMRRSHGYLLPRRSQARINGEGWVWARNLHHKKIPLRQKLLQLGLRTLGDVSFTMVLRILMRPEPGWPWTLVPYFELAHMMFSSQTHKKLVGGGWWKMVTEVPHQKGVGHPST